jgi:hypothetical protein
MYKEFLMGNVKVRDHLGKPVYNSGRTTLKCICKNRDRGHGSVSFSS